MKKTLSILLVVILLAMTTMTTFAATGMQDFVLSGVVDDYTDSKTGIKFSAPEEWSVTFSSVNHGAVGNGTRFTSRNINVYIGNDLIKIQQTGKLKAFVITFQNSGETYYVSPEQSIICLDGAVGYIDSADNSSWAIQERAVEAFLNSIQFSKTTK